MDFICYFGGVGPVSEFPQVKLFLDVFIFFKKMWFRSFYIRLFLGAQAIHCDR